MGKNTVSVRYEIYNPPFDDAVGVDKLDEYIDSLKVQLQRHNANFMLEYPGATNVKFQLSSQSPEYPEDGDNDSIWFGIVADRPMDEKELANQKKQDDERLEWQ